MLVGEGDGGQDEKEAIWDGMWQLQEECMISTTLFYYFFIYQSLRLNPIEELVWNESRKVGATFLFIYIYFLFYFLLWQFSILWRVSLDSFAYKRDFHSSTLHSIPIQLTTQHSTPLQPIFFAIKTLLQFSTQVFKEFSRFSLSVLELAFPQCFRVLLPLELCCSFAHAVICFSFFIHQYCSNYTHRYSRHIHHCCFSAPSLFFFPAPPHCRDILKY